MSQPNWGYTRLNLPYERHRGQKSIFILPFVVSENENSAKRAHARANRCQCTHSPYMEYGSCPDETPFSAHALNAIIRTQASFGRLVFACSLFLSLFSFSSFSVFTFVLNANLRTFNLLTWSRETNETGK